MQYRFAVNFGTLQFTYFTSRVETVLKHTKPVLYCYTVCPRSLDSNYVVTLLNEMGQDFLDTQYTRKELSTIQNIQIFFGSSMF